MSGKPDNNIQYGEDVQARSQRYAFMALSKGLTLYGVALVLFCLLSFQLYAQDVPRTPNYETLKSAIDSGSDGEQAAQRLESEKENKYRGGSDEDPKSNMEQLFSEIIHGKGSNVATWYDPHLRDAMYPESDRSLVIPYRSEAGCPIKINLFFCTFCMNGLGGLKTACPECQPENGGCPGQEWKDEHLFSECNYKNTAIYQLFSADTNFKTCCVRRIERTWHTEKIACTHSIGDGWAGLFEYYYPTEALGWENDRTTTMLASKEEVKNCLAQSDPLMEQKGVDWVTTAIKRNLKEVGGEESSGSDVQSNVSADIKDVRPKDEKLKFADSMQGEGLTLRVNLATMDEGYRRKLAEAWCMHPDQFMKLMDPSEIEDPLQKQPSGDLKKIPIWSNYCKEGVELMTNPEETARCENPDGTPTDLAKGYKKWKEDPLFCQRMNLSNTKMKEFFGGVLGDGGAPSEAETGYTCRTGGKLNGSMVPVEMYRHAAVERRTAISDHALGFLIAGGHYASMRDGKKSFLKRFEPRPYSRLLGMFTGKQFQGKGSGAINELLRPCSEQIDGDNLTSQNVSDKLYVSDFTHKGVFTKQEIYASKDKEFNRYVQEWADGGGKEKIANRGLDEKSSNYAAPFRLFATCPKGYVRWHPPGNHDPAITQYCGAENLGGNPLQP